MTPLAIVAAGLLVALAVLYAPRLETALRSRRQRPVIVTCKDGTAWRGVLHETGSRVVVLRNCQVVEAGEDRHATPVDGELLLQRGDVAYMQFP